MSIDFKELFGEGTELTPSQMALRAAVIFVLALVFVRLGRRSLGMGSSFDHVTAMLMGAVLSRAVVGASPFIATVCAACAIALMHKLFAFLSMYSRIFGKIIKGEAKLIYKQGQIIHKNMKLCLITENDLLEGIREAANVESLEEVEAAYIERDGRISVIKRP
jgi:uncharacterized membrane protein YcaP (DUF421 family)